MHTFLKTYWAGRISRAEYFAGVCTVFGFWISLGLLAASFAAVAGQDRIAALSFLAVSLGAAPPGLQLIARRVHDLGWSAAIPVGAFAVLIVPVLLAPAGVAGLLSVATLGACLALAMVLLLLVPAGQKAANPYGPPPKGLTPKASKPPKN